MMHQRHYCCSQLVFVRLIQFQRTVGPQLRISKASEISSENIIYIYMWKKRCVLYLLLFVLFWKWVTTQKHCWLSLLSSPKDKANRLSRWGYIQDVSESTTLGCTDKLPCWSPEKFLPVDKSFSSSIITPGVLLSSRLSGELVSSCQWRRAWHEARQPVLVQQLFFDS